MRSKNISIAISIGGKLLSAFLKVSKSLKMLLAAGTFGVYSFLFTWKFSLLVMFGVGLHELGHVWAMRKTGIKTKGFYFIPFFGGVAVSEESFKSGKDEAFIALMGPTVGAMTVIPPLIMYFITGSPLWAAAATWLATVNLFNLFPVNPLDGGRIIKSLSFAISSTIGLSILIAGFSLAIIAAIKFDLGLLLFITVIGMLELRPFATLAILPVVIAIELILSLIKLFSPADRGIVRNIKLVGIDFFVNIKYVFISQNKKPMMPSIYQDNSEHWKQTKTELLSFSSWYIGLIVLFVVVIMTLSHIPGAEVGKQFLKS